MIKLIHEFWERQNSFEKKIYWLILFAGAVVTFISIPQTMVQKIGILSVIAPICCFLIFIILIAVSLKTGVNEKLYFILCMILYFAVMPFNYFVCGGLTSGMPCYFIVSVILPTFGLKGKKKYVAFVIGILALISTIVLSIFIPDLVAELEKNDSIFDNIFSFVVCATALFLFSDKAVRTYVDEKSRANKLQDDMGEMSITDELTKLYNRRSFLSLMGKTKLDKAYIITIDIDDFKEINDKYSYHVGDRMLTQTAEILLEEVKEKNGEFAARYGGDKFVMFIYSDDEKIARDRMHSVSGRINRVEIPGFGELRAYANVHLIDCGKFETAKEIVKATDDMLYSGS